MPPRDRPVFKTYRRLRAVEDSLVETLVDAVPDESVDAVAAMFRIPLQGEPLYDHPDYGVLLDLAMYEDRTSGQTVIERHFEQTNPEAGSDEQLVLSAMMASRVTLLRLGKRNPGVGLDVEDLLFGEALFLADPALSKERTRGELVILTRLLSFDGFVMTPSTAFLDFEPHLARLLAAGLPKESTVPMADRYASADARRVLGMDLTSMALSSVESVRQALLVRFGGVPPA